MTDLQQRNGSVPQISDYITVSETGAEVSPDTPFEVWKEAAESWISVSESVEIVVGDLLQFGEARWPEEFAQVIGRNERTLENWKSICNRVPKAHRVEGLGISHLSAVKSLPPQSQQDWLEKAAPESEGERPRMTVRELTDAVRESEHGKAQEAETVVCERCQGSGRIPVEMGENS